MLLYGCVCVEGERWRGEELRQGVREDTCLLWELRSAPPPMVVWTLDSECWVDFPASRAGVQALWLPQALPAQMWPGAWVS